MNAPNRSAPNALPPIEPALKKQLNQEAKWSLFLTFFYLVGWVLTAYFSPDGRGVFGLPIWFELSCFLLPVLFIVGGFLVLKGVYQDIDLDKFTVADNEPNHDGTTSSDNLDTQNKGGA